MVAQKDGRKIFSLSSFLVSLGLTIFCGYLAFMSGFFSNIGDIFNISNGLFYGFITLLCGGFALSSCIHLLIAPTASSQENQVNGSNGTPQQVIPSPTKEPAKPTPYPATLPKPTSKAVEQKKGPPAPIAKTPATPLPITAEPQAVKLLGPVAKNNMQFLETFFKLATIAKDCQELVENEKELSKKEQIKLSLQRREFRQLFATVKNSRFETF